jgi:hypothetical protein
MAEDEGPAKEGGFNAKAQRPGAARRNQNFIAAKERKEETTLFYALFAFLCGKNLVGFE